MSELERVVEAKRQYEGELLRKAIVRGVGVGYKVIGGRRTGEPSVVALVTRKLPAGLLHPKDMVPAELGGIRTDVVEVGVVRIPPTPLSSLRQESIRPAPGGCSIGHVRATAGTLGCLVRRGAERFILSNNHVLAVGNFGVRGDIILQPGPLDGGRVPEDEIAELADHVPIDFSGPNRMDAAIAKPLSPDLVTEEILELGVPRGVAAPALGEQVVKSGRTTGVTRGTVEVVEATIDVLYGLARVRFQGQCLVVATGFSQGGDSGSVVLRDDGSLAAVGLLFAGSEKATVFTPILEVLSALRVELCTTAVAPPH